MTGSARSGTAAAGTTAHADGHVPRQAALGTNAFPALVRRMRLYTVPVYDYVLMTEPLSRRAARRASAGGTGRASATWPTSSTTTG